MSEEEQKTFTEETLYLLSALFLREEDYPKQNTDGSWTHLFQPVPLPKPKRKRRTRKSAE